VSESNPTTVVNKNRDEYDVYIGRGSRWGNNWSHMTGTKAEHIVDSRDEAVECYRHWLWAEIRAERVGVSELAALYGKRLGCYCAPHRCHGDVLASAAAWAKHQIDQESTEVAKNRYGSTYQCIRNDFSLEEADAYFNFNPRGR
jgi:hypothetical protein